MHLRLDEWLPVYREICVDFGFDPKRDEDAALLLSGKVEGDAAAKALAAVRERMPAEVVLCGAAETLGHELESLERGAFVVAADGATTDVLRARLRPEMIVTDLDGDVDDQVRANAQGAVVFVHAHGDNMRVLREHVPRFPGELVGTCQSRPPPGLFNFGGFTDGDRAACICAELGARRILLAGFDFLSPSDKPGRDPTVKRRKLAWAERILGMLSNRGVVIERLCDRR